MLQGEFNTYDLYTSGETADNDCEMGVNCAQVGVGCVCEMGPCTLYSEAHVPTMDTLMCEHCGKNRVVLTRYSEGYGTEEECVLSDPQRESDVDADIEDTDCRLKEPGTLQRISSRRRKRPRITRQDTTESEDDGGRSHTSRRWNLSPHRAHSRAILEESVSQVRPLVLRRLSTEGRKEFAGSSRGPRWLLSLWPSSLSRPVLLLLLLLSLSLVITFLFSLPPWESA